MTDLRPEVQVVNEKARDPVCGREVELGFGVLRTDYAGRRYFFCTVACRTRFDREPEIYVPAAESEA